MGTKLEPGKFDCYAKAAEDEPIFTLRAKDPLAPGLVRAWRYLSAGNLTSAMEVMHEALAARQFAGKECLPLDSEKSDEAAACATAMEIWQSKHR